MSTKRINVDLKIVLEPQVFYKFGDISNQIKKDGLFISEKFYSIIEGENLLTMTKSAGLTIVELSNIFKKIKPDVAVVLADRFRIFQLQYVPAI